jgi:hypothetical protein
MVKDIRFPNAISARKKRVTPEINQKTPMKLSSRVSVLVGFTSRPTPNPITRNPRINKIQKTVFHSWRRQFPELEFETVPFIVAPSA